MAGTRADDVVPAATWLGFAAMGLGMFMAILDIQVVATSLPTIQAALAISPDRMSWIQTGYLIAEIVAIPITGWLTRGLGLRGLVVPAIVVFTAASAGCAASGGFATLIAWRALQGFAGGMLIPSVFSAVFLLFPERRQSLATTIAGVLAVLAPTVGPLVGGWITETWSWHWLFLINVVPGLVAAAAAWRFLSRRGADRANRRTLDLVGLVAMAVALAALEIALKEAPHRGWRSGLVLGLLLLCAVAGSLFVRRALGRPRPFVDLRTLGERDFAIGCILSFVLGMGLYGSVYLMPVFLAYVRGHGPLAIGEIMIVTGALQLLTAPLAVRLEQRLDPRLLSAIGFGLFAAGLAMSAVQTWETDFAGMLWPQVVRGAAIMLCLLPPTRLALGRLAPDRVPDASALFNLMRNLGGAIGLALIDTIVFGRADQHAAAITARLLAGDLDTARAIGLPAGWQGAGSLSQGSPDAATLALVRQVVARAGTVDAVNEAWAMLAIVAAIAVFIIPFATRGFSTGRFDLHRRRS